MKNKKYSTVFDFISRVLGYLMAILVAVIFALYLSARTGWVFVFVLAVAPIFSFIITLVIKKINMLNFTVNISNNMIYKNETLVLKIKIKNRSILPIPVLLIQTYTPKALKTTNTKNGLYAVAVAPRGEVSFEIKYNANYWGKCNVGVKTVKLQDFMRLFTFGILNEYTANGYCEEVKIIPNIPDVPSDSPLVRTVAEEVQFYDDSEETKENDGISLFAGNPGYTHRDYIEGDPIKRINWKLSSKRDNLMVRLDDEIDSMQQNIILDSVSGDNVYDNEKAVEGVLAMSFSLIRLGFETIVWYKKDGAYINHVIESAGDVVALQTVFADYSFLSENINSSRLPDSTVMNGKISSTLVYTALADRNLRSEVNSLNDRGLHTSVIITDSAFAMAFENAWKLNDDFTAERITK